MKLMQQLAVSISLSSVSNKAISSKPVTSKIVGWFFYTFFIPNVLCFDPQFGYDE
jgi:hypothetical protein